MERKERERERKAFEREIENEIETLFLSGTPRRRHFLSLPLLFLT